MAADKQYKKRVSISIEPDLMKWSKEQAKKENRPFSNLIETLLKEYQAKLAKPAK